MVKLNYVTRKIEGVKLANSVCKDIRKKIPKEGLKPVKRVTGTVSDNIELNLTGKNIGDEGVALICEALIEGLSEGHFRLTELHLSGTSITVAGLASLAPVIHAASTQLRELNLSNNKISVRFQEDVCAWEDFLKSFSNVNSLIRLDLSGNPLGTELAAETLLRCYSKAKPIRVASTPDEGNLEELSEEQLGNGLTGQKGGIKQSDSINCGLRSIPFIILSDLDVTEGFALHISYIIEAHLPANTLLELHQFGTKPGTDLYSFIQSMEEHNNRSYCGIIYEPVRSISANAHKTLDAAVSEVIPELDDSSSESEDDPDDSPKFKTKKVQLGVFDVTRCRVKLQGSVLQTGDGTSLVQLWNAAVKMLSASRAIMLTKDNRKLFVKRQDAAVASQLAALTITPSFNPPTPKIQIQQQSPPRPITRENYDSAFPTLGGTPQQKTSRPPQNCSPVDLKTAAPLTPRAVNKDSRSGKRSKKPSPASRGSKLKWAEVKDAPAPKQETITFVVPRNCTLASLSNLPAPSEPAVPAPPTPIEAKITWHVGPPKNLITPLSSSRTGKKQLALPITLWKRILLEANDPYGLLSEKQLKLIWNYAVNFDTLVMGLEQMRGRRESDHIWRFLDSVSCLSYAIQK